MLESAGDGIERKLKLPTPAEIERRDSVTVLQAPSVWAWTPPSMVVDLSCNHVAPETLASKTMSVHGTFVGTYDRQYLFGFHHLHALIGPDGEFNCQEVENYSGRIEHHLKNLPPPQYIIPDLKRRDEGYAVSFERLVSRAITHLSGFTFFGSPIEPENWGMWLLHGILSAYSYVAAGQPGQYLCYAPNDWQKQLLQFIGVAHNKVVQQLPWTTYYCESVAIQQYSHIDLVPDTICKAIFKNIVLKCMRLTSSPGIEKLFVSRRSFTRKLGGKYRALINEDELTEALIALGYTKIEPELLPFEQQVALFARARIVVGLGGAAMFNSVFCNAGTKIVSIESTGVFALNHARLFSAMELEYGFIFGKQNSEEDNFPHNSWSIDVREAVRSIEAFE